MRYILPILTSVVVLVCLEPLAAAQTNPTDARGNQLLEAAVQSMLGQPSLEAKVRQRAKLFGQFVSGAGIYVQMRDGDRTLVRYEFKLQVGDQSTSFLHVNDGTTLWLRHDTGSLQSQAYVNLRRLRDAQRRMSPSTYASQNSLPDLAFGGMSQVLSSLAQNFEFGTPRETELSGLPQWEIVGKWKPERIAMMLPSQQARIAADQAADTKDLPTHIPDSVAILLGRDQNFRLFPYRIEYRRSEPRNELTQVARVSRDPVVTSLVTMELFEVRRRPDLTPPDFAFKPTDENVEDRTDMYLRKLGLLPIDR